MLTSIVISSTNRAFSPFMMHALPSVTKKETEATNWIKEAKHDHEWQNFQEKMVFQ